MRGWCAISPAAASSTSSATCVLVGGTGTGKTHLAIAIARACIRAGKRGRFYNTVDLVNRLEAEARAGGQGRFADYLDPPGLRRPRRTRLSALRAIRRPVALPSDQPALRAHLDHRHDQSRLRRMAERLRRRQNDHRACSTGSPTTATSSKPATKAGASRTAPDPKYKPHAAALAPAAQPRPAPPGRALPLRATPKGVNFERRSGVKFWTPIDNRVR